MTAIESTPSMLLSALWYARQGIAVFPLWWPSDGRCACPKGDRCPSPAKHPMTPQGFHDASADEEQVKAWWAKWPTANIGVPTGEEFDVVDIDGAAQAWTEFTAIHKVPEHYGVAMSGRAAGGFHYYCRPGGKKTVPSGKNGLPKGVEIKGVGGYVVAPPSLHVSGATYRWIKELSNEMHGEDPWPDWYDRITAKPERPRERIEFTPLASVSEDRASRYGAAVLVNACDKVLEAGEGGRWMGLATEAVPLAARAVAGGCLDRETAIRALEDAARRSGLEAAEANRVRELFATIERQGITNPIAPGPDPDAAIDTWLASLPKATLPPAYAEAVEEIRTRTSWWPRDLTGVLAGEDPEPEPEFLARLDEVSLFYRGKVNGLIGESESGKTWIAVLAVVQALTKGLKVAYFDFEDTAPGIVSRLRSMGASDDDLTRLDYIGPDETLHGPASADLTEYLAQTQPDLIVLDGFNAAMTLLGLELTDNTDATKFAQMLLKPLARTGACVVYVDHLPKNKENRGKGGIGAQAKRAMTTGCALSVEVVSAFGRGMTGRLRLTVDKDRPGHVRAAAVEAKAAGTAVLISGADGSVEVSIEKPDTDQERQSAHDAAMRRQIMVVVQGHNGGCRRQDIYTACGDSKAKKGTKEHVDWLLSHGQLVEVRRAGNQHPFIEVNPDPDQLIWDMS